MKGKGSKTVNPKKLKAALIKKALGYESVEVIEEYGDTEGEVKLLKKKVTKKDVPPDVTALKLLIESDKESTVESMTDEELEQEKERLYTLLDEERKKEKDIAN